MWRDLDWLPDEDKQALPVSARSNIAAALVGVFDSQVSGGKRYDLATAGRRLAHATYFASHGTDEESALNFAMDLTPLVENPSLPWRITFWVSWINSVPTWRSACGAERGYFRPIRAFDGPD